MPSVLVAFLAFQLVILNSSCVALQCYEWSVGQSSGQAVTASCSTESKDTDCVTIRLQGWNIITRQKLSLSMGMCDTSGCNTTQICILATRSVRNFEVQTCNAICCKHDLCNAISNSLKPSEGIRVTKKSVRAIEHVAVATDYNKDDDGDDYTLETGPLCFECKEGTDFYTCNSLPNMTRCGLEYNSCFSITGSLSRKPDDVIIFPHDLVTHRGCGLAAIGCNVTQLCIDTRNKLFVNHGIELKTCHGYCCSRSLCNSFNPTRPSSQVDTTRHRVTTKSRRIAKRSDPPPMKCHMCKPDSFGSMCTTNVTEGSCVTGSQGYDGCFTMTATITNATNGQVTDSGQWKGCAVRDQYCNANSSRCDMLADIMRERGLVLEDCLVSCCHGDLCNSYLPTAKPNLTAQALSKADVMVSPRNTVLMTSFISMVYHWLLGYIS